MNPTIVRGFLAAVLVIANLMPAATQQQSPWVKVCTLRVTGMTCAGCEAGVRSAAKTVDGVRQVKASYDKGNAEVTYDARKTTPEAIAKVITERSGFKAAVEPGKSK